MDNRIAIYGSRRQEPHLGELAALFTLLRQMGFAVTVHPKLAGYLRDKGIDLSGVYVSSRVADDTGLVLSIGGDGTFLRASRWVGRREIPVLGVNTGHLGFLADCSLPELPDMLERICRGDVTIERRMLLEVMCDALPETAWPFALNDICVMKEDSASMVTVHTLIDGNLLADYRADGLIIATPTGSTAYNLSAGGPILEPTINCIALAPVAPHTLTVRPLVVGSQSVLDLMVESRSQEFRLSIDGQSYALPVGERVRIQRAGFSTLLVRKRDTDFARILRDKLNWNL